MKTIRVGFEIKVHNRLLITTKEISAFQHMRNGVPFIDHSKQSMIHR